MKTIETIQESIRAAMAADELPITKLALKNKPVPRRTRKPAWFRVVRATTRDQPSGAWQFLGDYVKDEIEEPPGTIVLGKSKQGEYQLLIVMPGAVLRNLATATSASIEMRRRAQNIINDPASAIKGEISRAMHEAEEAQRLLERTGKKPAPKVTGSRTEWTEMKTREREWRRQIAEFDRIMDALPTTPPTGKNELRAEHRRLRLRLKHVEQQMVSA